MITVLKNRRNKILIYASCIAFFGLMSVLHWNMSLDLSDDGIFKEVLKNQTLAQHISNLYFVTNGKIFPGFDGSDFYLSESCDLENREYCNPVHNCSVYSEIICSIQINRFMPVCRFFAGFWLAAFSRIRCHQRKLCMDIRCGVDRFAAFEIC